MRPALHRPALNRSALHLVDYDLVCAAGVGLQAVRAALAQQKTGLAPNDFPDCSLQTFIGKVAAVDDYVWPSADAYWQSRNNALIELALQQGTLLASLARLRDQVGAGRIGLVMGSSTSSIDRAEAAYQYQRNQGGGAG